KASGGAAEQDIDRAKSEAEALNKQVRTLTAGARAADKQASAVAESVNAAGIGVQLAQAKVTSATAQVRLAEAARARAAVVVRDCTILAPLAGSVTQRNYEPGEFVMPGARVLTLVDTAEVRATFFLPNAELANAVPGRAVEVVADALPDTVIGGTIIRVGTEAEFTPRNVQTRDDRDRLVYAVEVVIPNADGQLRPGMPVEIEIPGTEID
ncbi:MAG: HlyD family secretion protein, partial [Myxococcota bacterium]